MYILNQTTQKNIKKRTGMSVSDIINMDFSTIDANIEKRIGRKLFNAKIGNGILFCGGSVYIALDRFLIEVTKPI